ncbi:nicotinate-nucleotide adenylyltransferase [Marivita sp. GX14005]|uniref:nicotinate-nucleotide adenylyltransferase n=1 Tax=Marivita sp. GX14005 TaxID=2942276 RepID=UPI002019BC8D|nr:nicotinate-nucleotide adenylyltransferase [Marivita sp. GX14005]MCL3880965.1 nicotinate-nucleotide adenylyltransferase [Marivita sp. GX14005]
MVAIKAWTGLPVRAGMTVGLLGGSFDPAHEGHLQISRVALKRFALDRVVWLVSPGNPLKARGPAALVKRIAHARALVTDPRIIVSDVEARIGTRYTAATLDALRAAHPGVRFVWLMGADNLQQFHLWDRWQDILRAVPLGVLARPGWRQSALHSRTARQYRQHMLPATASQLLPMHVPPVWCFVNMPMTAQSSTAIRARGDWRE